MRIVLIVWLFGIANLTKAQGNSDFKNIDRLSVNVFKMLDGSELTILSDTVEMTSKIQLNGKLQEAELKFVIPPDSTTVFFKGGVWDVINTLVHENDHRSVGPAVISDRHNAAVELRAISTQKAHRSWRRVSNDYITEISRYEKSNQEILNGGQ